MTGMKTDPKKALTALGASAQVIEKIQKYTHLIEKWQKAINLVAPSTLGDLWGRHILDSAMLWPVVAGKGRIIDLGSGGGLPGIVLAAMGAEHVTMIESDTRKCIFLQETSRELGLTNVSIISERIENPREIQAPVIMARALAPLKTLVEWASPMLSKGGIMVFPKGESWKAELTDLGDRFHVEQHPSMTDTKAKIIVLSPKTP
jgi:16S rRNA (guanine527-N7)-methyltransferase